MTKTWFITGASRGLGTDIAKAALAAGHHVVATGRKRESVVEALGQDSDRFMALSLDVTDAAQASRSIDAAVRRFGGIDVLVNNAGFGYMGFFEDSTVADIQEQLNTNLLGAMHVTRAALPHMRKARSGRIFNVSSLGGMVGAELGSLYCATKFGLEGFSECLAKEVAPFGVFVTIIQPGPFRTDFLTSDSARYATSGVSDYGDRRRQLMESTAQRNGNQPGDPARLARAMVQLAGAPNPPRRFLGGAIAVTTAMTKLDAWRAEIESWRELSVSCDGDFSKTNVGMLLDQLK